MKNKDYSAFSELLWEIVIMIIVLSFFFKSCT